MMPPNITSPTWSSRTRRAVLLGSVVLLLIALFVLRDMLPLVVVSAVLAYLFNPVVSFIEFRLSFVHFFSERARRGVAVLLTFVLVIVLFTVLLLVVLPAVMAQLEEFGRSLPRIMRSVEGELERVLSEPIIISDEPLLMGGEPFIPLERLREATGAESLTQLLQLDNLDVVGIAERFMGSLGQISGPAFSFLGGAVTTIVNVSFLLVLTFYLMRDGRRFTQKLVDVSPPTYRGDTRRLLYELGRVWNAYLRGQLILCLAVGMAVYLAALVLGLPNAPILGLLAGFLEFVPNVGPFLALIPAAFLALVSQSATLPFLEGLPFMLVVIVVWVAIQNLESIFLVPRVMGTNLNLHPFVVILGLLGGASVAGPLGVILAAPFIASARVLGQYIYGKMNDLDPFPNARPRVQPDQTRLRRLRSSWPAVYGSRVIRRIRRRGAPAGAGESG